MTTPKNTLRAALTLVLASLVSGCQGGGQSEIDKARTDIDQIAAAVEAYTRDSGDYPDAVARLVEPGSGSSYLDGFSAPVLDPWGNPYKFLPPHRGGDWKVVSFGADGAPGGRGDKADLVGGPDRIR